MPKATDVDIDVKNTTTKSKYGVRAIIYDEDKQEIQVHPSGVYLDSDMPIDPETGYASIDYKDADERGFFKVDLLNVSVYDGFKSKKEVMEHLKEPDWDRLNDPDFVSKLPHIGKYFDLVSRVQPKSIEALADVIALIRPGKKHLIEPYLKNPVQTRKMLYKRPGNNQYWFKKSHSIGYAHLIVVAMNKRDPLSWMR